MTLRDRVTIWATRALVGLALLYCSEVLGWSSDPLALTAGAWAARGLITLVIAALVLDLMARFGVGELFGLLVLAGLYGLLNGALITGSAFSALPLSLLTRPLGLHTLGGGLLALLLLAWLLDGRGFVAWRAAMLAGVGVLWGVWVRWYPLLPANDFPVPGLATALALAAGGIAVLGLLLAGTLRLYRQRPLVLETALRLTAWEWGAVLAVLFLAYAGEAGAGRIRPTDGALLGLLVGYLILLLAFLRGQAARPFVRRLDPPRPVSVAVFALYAALLVLPAAAGYALPGSGPDGLPLRALTTGLTLFGLVWLPGVSLGLGFRTYIRLFRQGG